MTGLGLAPMGAPAAAPSQGAAGAPGQVASGTPAAPSFWASLFKAAPGAITDLLKYQQQQSLLNPSSLAKNAQETARINAAALRKAIFPQVTAQLQETGNINAPYLASQAYTTAIAPIVAQMQEAAMNQWLEANREAMGLYPSASDISALGGLTNPSIFGGSGGGQ